MYKLCSNVVVAIIRWRLYINIHFHKNNDKCIFMRLKNICLVAKSWITHPDCIFPQITHGIFPSIILLLIVYNDRLSKTDGVVFKYQTTLCSPRKISFLNSYFKACLDR